MLRVSPERQALLVLLVERQEQQALKGRLGLQERREQVLLALQVQSVRLALVVELLARQALEDSLAHLVLLVWTGKTVPLARPALRVTLVTLAEPQVLRVQPGR